MLEPSHYTIAIDLLIRGAGVIYFFAFFPFLFQMKGLLGSDGILPIRDFLKLLSNYKIKNKYVSVPTLFWINSSDPSLMGVVIFGLIFSILLIFGVQPAFMLFLLYCLYLSIVNAGQDFLSFGWEGFFLEITAHLFLLSLTVVPNIMVWISLNFLLFRFYFQAGASKLMSRDVNWRNLTALSFHYQTQPLPNTQAWFFYKLPMSIQKISTLYVFLVELICIFGIFGTDWVRLFTFITLFILIFFIWFTGNFSYLNHLSVVFSIILLNNTILRSFSFLHISKFFLSSNDLIDGFITLSGFLLLLLQIISMADYYFPHFSFKRILYLFSPFHLGNRYGIFAVMTTERDEVVIEGSLDKKIWKEYTFHYKPSEITKRPCRISPYQPRLDWQMWFLPFQDFYAEDWFHKFLFHLLKGNKQVLGLINENPFKETPPVYIRAMLYQYEFSSQKEKKEWEWWWRRKLLGIYCPILTLNSQKNRLLIVED